MREFIRIVPFQWQMSFTFWCYQISIISEIMKLAFFFNNWILFDIIIRWYYYYVNKKKSEKFRRVKYFLINFLEKWRLVQTQSFLNEEFMSTGFQSKVVRLKSELYSLHLDLSLMSIWLVQVIFKRNNLNICWFKNCITSWNSKLTM